MLRQLAERTADHLGYRPPHRDDVVCAIEQAVLGVFEPSDTAYTHVELRLAANGRDMQVRIRYLGASLSRDGATVIEQLLSRSGPDGVPLERLRQSMRTVVLGRGPEGRRRRLLRADHGPARSFLGVSTRGGCVFTTP